MLRALFIVSIATFGVLNNAWAESSDENPSSSVDIAQAYLDAYSTFDMSLVEPFLAEDAVFRDDTSTVQAASGGPFHFVGKDAYLKGLGDYVAQFEYFRVDYDVRRRWESNDIVVFVADLTYEGKAADSPEFSGSLAAVTVITVRDGKVVLHKDYLDYEGNVEGK